MRRNWQLATFVLAASWFSACGSGTTTTVLCGDGSIGGRELYLDSLEIETDEPE